jgi:hypothetical protein
MTDPIRPVWCDHYPWCPTVNECQVKRRDENRFEPVREKRCHAPSPEHCEGGAGVPKAFCNRTLGHADEHERWSHTGIRIHVWPQAASDGGDTAHEGAYDKEGS